MAIPKYNTYVGMRYVPIFDGEWDRTKTYEPLTIVSYQGNSYTSRTFIPVGMDINNTTYWALTGNYNAQVEYYRQETARVSEEVEDCVHKFNTVSDMINDEDIEIGNVCKTLGYYTANDGGSGLYNIREANTGEEATGGSTIELDNGLIAELIPVQKNVLNFKQWGAVADGETDNTGVYEACIEYIKENYPVSYITGDRGTGGGIIYIPSGKYYFASQIEARHYVAIIGENRYTTVITSDASRLFYSSRDDYPSGDDAIGRQWNFKLQNLTFKNCVNVLYQVQSINTVIENCSFVGCTGSALRLTLTANVTIRDCMFYTCKKGLYFQTIGVGPSTAALVERCWFAHCGDYGIHLDFSTNGIETLCIRDSIFEYNKQSILATGSETYPTFIKFDNCYFEGNTTAGSISACSVYAGDDNLFDSTDQGINVTPYAYTNLNIENDGDVGFALSRVNRGKIKFTLNTGRTYDTWKRLVYYPSSKGISWSVIPAGSYTVIVVYQSDTGYYMGSFSVTVNSDGTSTASKIADIAGNLTIAINNNRFDVSDETGASYISKMFY